MSAPMDKVDQPAPKKDNLSVDEVLYPSWALVDPRVSAAALARSKRKADEIIDLDEEEELHDGYPAGGAGAPPQKKRYGLSPDADKLLDKVIALYLEEECYEDEELDEDLFYNLRILVMRVVKICLNDTSNY